MSPIRLAIGMDYIRNTIRGGVECKNNYGRELTVSTDAMGSHSMKLWKKGIITRKDKWAKPQVSRAIRYMLEEFGDIEKLDAGYFKGISMRYMVAEKYHAYDEVVKHVGVKTINTVTAKGMSSLIKWDDMGSTA